MSKLPKSLSHPSPAPLASQAYQDCLYVEEGLASNWEDRAQTLVEWKRLINASLSATDKLVTLGEYYDQWFQTLNAETNFQTPSPPQWSRDEYDSLNEHTEAKAKLLTHPKDHHQAREAALIRDGWRCIISRAIDQDAHVYEPEAFPLHKEENQFIHVMTVHHIIPVLTKPQTYKIFEYFGYPGLKEELDGKKVHCLKNLLTISRSFHGSLDDQSMWLDPIEDTPNSYRLGLPDENRGSWWALHHHLRQWKIPETFHFRTDCPELDLPCSRLIALHATSCKVTQLSGLYEYLKKVDRMVLASSREPLSADLLAAKLMETKLVEITS
ncbi:hypothetical protein PQX77_017253 [Marasmius sp. AFHP31]|nr:hypothetical protein PQX77_017253 [Marasmius sp. AFHP31]